MNIARWTTPSITYKPSAVSSDEIKEIRLVIEQGNLTITKTQDDATIADGTFYWQFTQEETGKLESWKPARCKIDYLTLNGKRYTTQTSNLSVSSSAVDEVIL